MSSFINNANRTISRTWSSLMALAEKMFAFLSLHKKLVLTVCVVGCIVMILSPVLQVIIAYLHLAKLLIYIMFAATLLLAVMCTQCDWLRNALSLLFPFVITAFYADVYSSYYGSPYMEWIMKESTTTSMLTLSTFIYACAVSLLSFLMHQFMLVTVMTNANQRFPREYLDK
ncbi:hypothetical protein [Pontibacillus litoralis]|uniref:Uncharacterized protein n=1 Tax=Pontibacillus litoralis JSM 072002 TaxID=1385512 RepID=A0A0A5HR60_9BACI|nr:hypothetical protein [Pontibacillus litoralis]KGX86102.1 hypothetical protein N784_05940 [Pontibacillus litoralis JSM 072002]